MQLDDAPQSVAELITIILSIAIASDRTPESECELQGALAELDCSTCHTMVDAVGLFDLAAALYGLAVEQMKEQEFLATACFEAAERYQGLAKAFLSDCRVEAGISAPVLH